MTRKDYELIAGCARAIEVSERIKFFNSIAPRLKTDNRRFDYEEFFGSMFMFNRDVVLEGKTALPVAEKPTHTHSWIFAGIQDGRVYYGCQSSECNDVMVESQKKEVK